jgi:3-hydroxyisobutyrate dehydrogenase and related beta-hydroxyacid dehydrogenases
MSDNIGKIGFIGLGSMGGDQARELAKNFANLTVYDAFPKALAAFEGRASLAASIADVGKDAYIVGICVRDDAQVNECVEELLPAMKSGSILLIHSTVAPATAISIAERGKESGIDVIDAPVSRTEMTKDGPFVFCMTGGNESAAERANRFIMAFSTNTMHVGRLGAAMALKISNNLISWCEIMIGLEAVNIAEAAGVPVEKLLTVMKRNGVMTPPMQGFINFWSDPGDADRRAFFASQAEIGEKDLSLAEALAKDANRTSPIASHIRSTIKEDLLAVCKR